MAKYRTALPTLGEGIFVSYTGIETDLIFNRGIDLPGFASYPLLETEEGREMLRGYYAQLIDIARQKGVGVLLESLTWVANRDRGAAIGHNPASLKKFNIAAIDLLSPISTLTSPEFLPPVIISCFFEKWSLTLLPIVPLPPIIRIFISAPFMFSRLLAGFFAGLFPALKAATMEPIDALQYM